MEYHIIPANPAGNITLLVLDEVSASRRASLSAALMSPGGPLASLEAEQVGFVSAIDDDRPRLDMMGGEFCGNATRSMGLFIARRRGIESGRVTVWVSGCDHPLEVEVDARRGRAYVEMPLPRSTEELAFPGGALPLVRFEGISHAIAENLPPSPAHFEQVRRAVEAQASSDAIGVMYLNGDAMTPAVHVGATGTTVWERSCGSGSVATAAWRGRELADGRHHFRMRQPGGVLEVELVRENGRLVRAVMGGPVELGEERVVSL